MEEEKEVIKSMYLDKEKEIAAEKDKTIENIKYEIRLKFQELMNENLLK